MRPEVLKRFAGPVPRYTSYPTAPNFSPAIDAKAYGGWLQKLPADTKLSLYVHIPYCHELCWYCGCNTKATKKYEPIARYLPVLFREIESVASRIRPGLRVSHIHWGGGSPNVLSPDDIRRLADHIRRCFRLAHGAEFAIEMDPRTADEETIRAFAEAGVNRVSIGVQDFDLAVQKAINRIQSFEQTRDVVAAFRSYGIRSLNIDLVYGLPHQTRDSVRDTVMKVLQLRPNRVAMFGYAHLPQRLKHQRLIEDSTLPGIEERFAQSNRAANIFQASGYLRVGLDHFVLPDDRLAKAEVHRNFQGYTDDHAPVLIGFGASAIGRLPQGYVQNSPEVGEYMRRIETDGLATARGHAMTAEDNARSFAIERMMCDLRFPAEELRRNFGQTAEPVIEEAECFLEMEHEGLVEKDPREGGVFRITEKGRLFLRSICSVFDRYLDEAGTPVGSQGV
jgi:oxygen-independent coproporphyrinogen III oxidase